jgi:hypothetical protein
MSSSAAAAAATAVVKAPPQAGVLEGVNPVHFDAKNPIILFIVQVCLLLCEKSRSLVGVALGHELPELWAWFRDA